jgi:hypothetical protein
MSDSDWYGGFKVKDKLSLALFYPARLDPTKSEQWRGVLNIRFSVLKGKFSRFFILDAHEKDR